MALTKITSRILDSSGVTILGTIATGVWEGTPINQTYLVGQSGTNTGDETLARINALDVTELGTISSGVWQGSVIAEAYLQNQSGTNTGDQTNISGNAGTVTNGVYTVGNQTIGGTKSFSENVIIGTAGASSNRYQLRFEKWNSSHSYPSITFLTPTGNLRSGIGVNTSNDFVIGRTSSVVDTNFTHQDLKISNTTGDAIFSGKVGIGGTTSPGDKLEIQQGYLRMFDPSATANAGYPIRWSSNNGGSNVTFAEITGVTTSSTNRTGDLVFSTSSAGGPTEKMRISSGGTATFSNQLKINAANGNQLYLNNSGEQYTQITFDHDTSGSSRAYLAWDNASSFFEMYAKSGGGLKFFAGGTEKLTILSGGNVGIGTSTIESYWSGYTALKVGYNNSIFGNTADSVGSAFFISQNLYNDGSNYRYVGSGSDEGGLIDLRGGAFVFSNAPLGTAGNVASIVPRLTISSGGDATFSSKVKVSDGGNTTVPSLRVGSDTNGLSSPSTNQLNFITNSLTRLTISSTGEVSMPFQPSAMAHKNGTFNEGSGNNFVTGWSLQHNIGGDLATTGSFTCSKAGRYLCTFSPMSGQTSGDVQFRIFKNSAIMLNSNSMAQGGGGGAAPWRQTTVSGVIDCAAGDVLKPAAYSSASSSTPQVYSGNYSTLSFHFLG